MSCPSTELTDAYVKMVQSYADLWHNSIVPDGEARTRFVARMVDDFLPESASGGFTVAEWLREQDRVAAHLAEAVDCVARAQEARWQN